MEQVSERVGERVSKLETSVGKLEVTIGFVGKQLEGVDSSLVTLTSDLKIHTQQEQKEHKESFGKLYKHMDLASKTQTVALDKLNNKLWKVNVMVFISAVGLIGYLAQALLTNAGVVP